MKKIVLALAIAAFLSGCSTDLNSKTIALTRPDGKVTKCGTINVYYACGLYVENCEDGNTYSCVQIKGELPPFPRER